MAPTAEVRCAPGTKIYITCPEEVWRTAEVMSIDDKGCLVVKVDSNDETVVLKKEDVFHMCNTDVWNTTGLSAPTDLTLLTHLHEAAVLDSLHIRFDVDSIYTFTGPILIAVNPFKNVKGMYSDQTLARYIDSRACQGIPVEESADFDLRAPHVFAVSRAAYDGLCKTKRSQTILISGESGAGKTESTKFVMKYLACAGSEYFQERSTVELQVLESNPLLEAFGNARTLRNDNSSRFGKFIELQFQVLSDRRVGELGRLCGASIKTYLLEKVRICSQQEGERNYHIFYQLCAAAQYANSEAQEKAGKPGVYTFPSPGFSRAEHAEVQDFDLSAIADRSAYRILTTSSCYQLNGVDDRREFENTIFAMQTLGLTHGDISCILKVIGAVMYIGNVDFVGSDRCSDTSALSPNSEDSIKAASDLLQIPLERLKAALLCRTIKTMAEKYTKALRVEEAADVRDSLCRAIYGCLFLKIVAMTNRSTEYSGPVNPLFCGVLDIFGFECFALNSFEQLCINFTNERLQQFFNTFVFKCEEELYKKEGIEWDPLDFPDNQDCVAILAGKPIGVFAMLDEECLVPGGKDKSFNSKICQKFSGHVRFGIVKQRQNAFVIKHFAGAVEYCSDGFLEKNKDQLSHDCQSAVCESSEEFVSTLFPLFLQGCSANAEETKMMKRRTATVSSEFRDQLTELMLKVDSTAPHFIRCIKPNPQNLADVFDRVSVNEQLRYGGVLQAVVVSRAGYPVRGCHKDTFCDYKPLADKPILKSIDTKYSAGNDGMNWKNRAQELLTHLNNKYGLHRKEIDVSAEESEHQPSTITWAVGNTMCFFKNEAYEVLATSLTDLRSKKATCIQAQFKCFMQQRSYRETRRKIVCIQKFIRGTLARRLHRSMLETSAAIKIQGFGRSVIIRKRYLRYRHSIIRLQAYWKGKQIRAKYEAFRRDRAASKIQATYRMHVENKAFRRLRCGAIKTQLHWKKILARRLLRKLRQDAKEVSSLLARAQDMQQELNEGRTRRAELETLVSTLQAKNEDLKKQLTVATTNLDHTQQELSNVLSANKSLMQQLQSFKKALNDGTDASQSQSPEYSNHETPVSTAPSSNSVASIPPSLTSIKFKRQFTSDALIARSTAAAHKNDEDVRQLREAIQNREKEEKIKHDKLKQENDNLIAQLQEMAIKLEAESALREEAEARYKLILEESTARSAAATVGDSISLRKASDAPHHNNLHNPRWIDILLLGAKKAGKTGLIEQMLVKVGDALRLQQLRDARQAEGTTGKTEQLYRIQYNESRVVACVDFPSAVSDFKELLQGRIRQSYVIGIVFDPSIPHTWDEAMEMYNNIVKPVMDEMAELCMAEPRIYFVENFWRVSSKEGEVDIDRSGIRDTIAGLRCRYVSLVHLSQLIQEIIPWLDGIEKDMPVSRGLADEVHRALQQPRLGDADAIKEAVLAVNKSGQMAGGFSSALLKSLRQILSTSGKGGAQNDKGQRNHKDNSMMIPSIDAPEKWTPRDDSPVADIIPVCEINDNKSALTYLVFGKERGNADYILLAVATKEGQCIIYRCWKTAAEREMNPEASPGETPSAKDSIVGTTIGDAPRETLTVHSVLNGHTRAVTSMFFTLLDDHLVTTSIDKSVRFWYVDTGDMLKVFTDSSPALSAAFLPFNPSIFVASNANSVLRLVCSNTGKVLQKLKVESEVRALRFDDTGLFCFAGTKSGAIHILEAGDNLKMNFKYKHTIGKGAITCITFVPSHSPSHHPCLLVNTCDKFIAVVDCIYGHPTGALSNLVVRQRIRISHSILPLRCCYSSAGNGWLVSASENKQVFCYPLHGQVQKSEGFNLAHHKNPILAVAVNAQNTLMASCDSGGSVVLWRRLVRNTNTNEE